MDFQQLRKVQANIWDPPSKQAAPAIGAPPPQPQPAAGPASPALSPERLADRARAREELADRFSVVPDDFVGPRLPNEVSGAEYEKVSNTFSDIRTRSSNIWTQPAPLDTFDPEAEKPERVAETERRMMDDLASILQTASGRELLEALATERTSPITGFALDTQIRGAESPDRPIARSATTSVEETATALEGGPTSMKVDYTPGEGAERSDTTLFWLLTQAMHGLTGGFGTASEADPAMLAPEDREDAGHLRAIEYAATGLGGHAGERIHENAYRAERRALASRPGARPGDEELELLERFKDKKLDAEEKQRE
jgi:hypothetical protein